MISYVENRNTYSDIGGDDSA
ncbi:Protein of unknown function [Bacillus mycoides]|nr:Protein of unknown function [Bacillus mycoides]